MVVCMSRRIAIEVYKEIVKLKPEWHSENVDDGTVKVIMTSSSTDPLDWQPFSTTKEEKKRLAQRFKDPEDELKMVIVVDMWLTGFDAPSCSTVYLDKPMRNHTLMQTIARANRVFPGKHSGLIVDYANVFASLEKALAIYGAGKNGTSPVKNKEQLVAELRRAITDATTFCAKQGVKLSDIEQFNGGGMDRLQAIADALNAFISPDPLRRYFLGHERLVSTLYKAVKPDPVALEFASRSA